MKKGRGFEIPLEVCGFMKGFTRPWFVAGGWAMDLYLGRITREHSDIEIAILREDQLELRSYLECWEFKKIRQGKLEPWFADERLELPVHEIHARRPSVALCELEILLNESDGHFWVYRRNPLVKRELSLVSMSTKDNIPYLAPEIVLLYKAKDPKLHDERDFQNVRSRLDKERSSWFRRALATCHPHHRWNLASG